MVEFEHGNVTSKRPGTMATTQTLYCLTRQQQQHLQESRAPLSSVNLTKVLFLFICLLFFLFFCRCSYFFTCVVFNDAGPVCVSASFPKDEIGGFYLILTLLSRCQIFTMRYTHNVLSLGSDILKYSLFFVVFFCFLKNSLLLEMNSELLPFKMRLCIPNC